MLDGKRWRAGFALVALALPLLLAGGANAQYREFSGRIEKVNEKRLVVAGRGDRVRFGRLPQTTVRDTRAGLSAQAAKREWQDLARGDWVAVKWKLADKPRNAYEVIVLPPRKQP